MGFRRVLIIGKLIISLTVFSQEDMKPIKWVIRPSFGITTPLSTLSGGYITDNLIGFESNRFYWQFISSTYFFSNWGIEFTFATNRGSLPDNRYKKFSAEVEKKYSDNYFVNTRSTGTVFGR